MGKEEEDLSGELAFMAAMRAYRNARESGDPQEVAEAEDAWREMVRAEMYEQERRACRQGSSVSGG